MDLRSGRALLALVAAVACCTMVGCGGGEATTAPGPATGGTGTGAAQPAKDGGPLTDLPECEAPPEGAADDDVAGLVLPDGAVVTEVEDLGELVSVRAYVEQTPIQVRQFYADEPGLQLFEIEDEVYEAEVLFGGGEHRSYVKAQAQCQQGSLLTVYVGPAEGGGLPTVP